MFSGLKFASIDIGSNAMRLLFCRVLQNSESAKFIKESLIRMPLRLGEDAFTEGNISKENGEKWTTNSRDIVVSNSLIHNKLTENLTLL